jgi:hypothetical protein
MDDGMRVATRIPQESLSDARLHSGRCAMIAALAPRWQGGAVCEPGVGMGDFSAFLLDSLRPARFDAYDIFTLHKLKSMWGKPMKELLDGRTHRDFCALRFADRIADGTMRLFEGDGAQPRRVGHRLRPDLSRRGPQLRRDTARRRAGDLEARTRRRHRLQRLHSP